VKSGFGKLGPNNKSFSFQASKFEGFRSSFTMQGACETTQRKLKGTKKHAKSDTLCCAIRDNFASAFVCVPSSKGFVRVKKNTNATKCLPDVLMALGGQGNTHESLLDLLTHIAQNEDCKATWEEAVRANGLIVVMLCWSNKRSWKDSVTWARTLVSKITKMKQKPIEDLELSEILAQERQ
jgi:hypothetical protein